MHLAGLVGSYPAMTAQLLRARPPSGYGWPVSPARSWLPRPTVAAAGTWREQQRQVIEEGLDQIGARLEAERREEELASRERELRGIAAALDQAEGGAPSGSPSHRPYW
jgi:hypothetical protein